jgi:hypothetical protein
MQVTLHWSPKHHLGKRYRPRRPFGRWPAPRRLPSRHHRHRLGESWGPPACLDALARGDSAGALRLLRVATDSLRANGGANAWITAPLDLEVGKLLLSAGRLDQAEPRLLGVTASPWLRVLGEWYLGRLAELRGDPAATREHYGRVVRWWHDCDPELRPLWEEARRRLTHVRSNVAAANRQT